MDDSLIPKQLQRSDFKFTKVGGRGKKPLEKGWTTTVNYFYSDARLQDHINSGGNYGVLCGEGGLIVIDADTEELKKAVDDSLQKTFSVQTGGGGQHFYFLTDRVGKNVLQKDGIHLGEIQGRGAQVVGPGSTHSNGKQYLVLDDLPIARVPRDEIDVALSAFLPAKQQVQTEDNQVPEVVFPIDTVIPLTGFKRKPNGELQGSHPFHGSESGENFTINLDKGKWHCFRHNCGGVALNLLAQKEGLIECGQELKGDAFLKTMELARDKCGLQSTTPDPSTGIKILRDSFKKWLYIEDDDYISIVLGVFISHEIPGDPAWMYIVGPSSDCKTEMLRAFTTTDVVLTQSISSKTLISGVNPKDKNRRKYDLAPRLHKKIWMIYDFSEMLAKKAEERNDIFSQLRSLYDGTVSRTFGTGAEVVYGTGKKDDPKIHCTLLAASTPVIDAYFLEQQLLGTRHLFYRVNTQNGGRIMKKISENDEKTDQMRAELNQAVRDYLSGLKIREVNINETTIKKIEELTSFMIKMRAGVSIDRYTDEVTQPAYPEKPGRAYKMLLKLYKALQHIPDLTGEDCLRIIQKVVKSTIPDKRLRVLEQVLNLENDEYTANTIARPLRIGNRVVRRELNALWQLDYVEKREEYDQIQRKTVSYYRIKEEQYKQLKRLMGGIQETLDVFNS